MQKVKQNIKQYTNDFKEIYDISSILKYAIILNIALFGIEKSKLLQKVELEPLNIAIGVLLIMLVLVIIQQLHLIDSLKLKIVNNVDAVLLIFLISSFIYFLIFLMSGSKGLKLLHLKSSRSCSETTASFFFRLTFAETPSILLIASVTALTQ